MVEGDGVELIRVRAVARGRATARSRGRATARAGARVGMLSSLDHLAAKAFGDLDDDLRLARCSVALCLLQFFKFADTRL